MARESVILEDDTVDAADAGETWLDLAQQLKQDLASIILMSEANLQVPTIVLISHSICCHVFLSLQQCES